MSDERPPGWLIWPDQIITRRKRYHFVTDPERNITFRSRLLFECVLWLEAEGIEEYTLWWSDTRPIRLACRPHLQQEH